MDDLRAALKADYEAKKARAAELAEAEFQQWRAQQTVTFHGSPHYPIEIETLLAKSAADPDLPPVFLHPCFTAECRLDARVLVDAIVPDAVLDQVRRMLNAHRERGVAEAGWRHHVAVETAYGTLDRERIFRVYVWETTPPAARVRQLPAEVSAPIRIAIAPSASREVPLRRAVWHGQFVRAAYDEETNTVFVTP